VTGGSPGNGSALVGLMRRGGGSRGAQPADQRGEEPADALLALGLDELFRLTSVEPHPEAFGALVDLNPATVLAHQVGPALGALHEMAAAFRVPRGSLGRLAPGLENLGLALGEVLFFLLATGRAHGQHSPGPEGASGTRGGGSAKPTQFGILIDPEYALERFLVLLDAAKIRERALWIDMEAASTTDATIWVYERLLERYNRVGLCLQANLRRTASDLDRLVDLGARIRLTKGAYREAPDIAFMSRPEIDRNFLAYMETLFNRASHFAIATHDGRLISRARERAASSDTPFEFQMLQGVRETLKAELVAGGYRVLEYIPYGPNWLPYFSRRLRERPRNVITMVRSLVSG